MGAGKIDAGKGVRASLCADEVASGLGAMVQHGFGFPYEVAGAGLFPPPCRGLGESGGGKLAEQSPDCFGLRAGDGEGFRVGVVGRKPRGYAIGASPVFDRIGGIGKSEAAAKGNRRGFRFRAEPLAAGKDGNAKGSGLPGAWPHTRFENADSGAIGFENEDWLNRNADRAGIEGAEGFDRFAAQCRVIDCRGGFRDGGFRGFRFRGDGFGRGFRDDRFRFRHCRGFRGFDCGGFGGFGGFDFSAWHDVASVS